MRRTFVGGEERGMLDHVESSTRDEAVDSESESESDICPSCAWFFTWVI
jgi:hypothetical protein